MPVNFDLTIIINKNDNNLDFRQNIIQIPLFLLLPNFLGRPAIIVWKPGAYKPKILYIGGQIIIIFLYMLFLNLNLCKII